MRDSLDLLYALGSAFQPGIALVLGDQIGMLRVFIGFEFVEFGLQALLEKRVHSCTKTQPKPGCGDFGHRNSF